MADGSQHKHYTFSVSLKNSDSFSPVEQRKKGYFREYEQESKFTVREDMSNDEFFHLIIYLRVKALDESEELDLL